MFTRKQRRNRIQRPQATPRSRHRHVIQHFLDFHAGRKQNKKKPRRYKRWNEGGKVTIICDSRPQNLENRQVQPNNEKCPDVTSGVSCRASGCSRRPPTVPPSVRVTWSPPHFSAWQRWWQRTRPTDQPKRLGSAGAEPPSPRGFTKGFIRDG